MSLQLFSKPSNRWIVGLALAATALAGTTVSYGVSQLGRTAPSAQPAPTIPKPTKVTALGRLEPRTEVLKLSAPQALDGDRVVELLVKQGERIQTGQVIAVLDSRDRLQSALQEAQEKIRNAQAQLAQVQAGAKTGEIAAQKQQILRLQAEIQGELATQQATISRRQSELKNAQVEYDRYQSLATDGAISSSNFDQKRLVLETAQAQLREAQSNQNLKADSLRAQIQEARATLDKIAEVRPVDVQTAQTEVAMAIAAAKKAEAELQQAYIRAPIAGQILKIHTRPGEKLSSDGIADLAQTDDMVAVAEIYQTDIDKIRLGQSATITGQGFSGAVKGTVSEIGLQVSRQNVFSAEPGENLDRRVVEVKIRLDPASSKRVAGLTNLQVQTAIAI
ncbi:ABC exporter membrane fusion protein [Phormidium sp. CLA17]|uniref:ABC exporter membrane fusion protein n=1 Tax=Leptolyngbya sp. Cla-17 TaxID=2803751 RepID=UPI0014922F04|nr:ABC exporter membrane fusion protein [Leptolyngbya sp. Cla-17]MBM0741102.1 ABC exporter membrane fusion protein [Leptolyngbya sp. Cla-17]